MASVDNTPVSGHVWVSLRDAIASSSGFQRWKLEKALESRNLGTLDQQISLYLRETLATLAY